MKKITFSIWRSWLMAMACCLVYGLLVIAFMMSPLFYVELIKEYNIDRKTASIPFVVMAFVRTFSGFIFGMLGEKFGLQRMMYVGCYLSVLGVGASYFAKDVIALSFTLGLIYAFGVTSAALLHIIIREHFDDTATTISNGLIILGPCFTSIIFPAVTIYFIEKYDVFGAFLLISGITLNSLPFIMILKPRTKPPKIRKAGIETGAREPFIKQGNLGDIKDSDEQEVPLNMKENITDSNIVREDEVSRQVDQNGDKVDITQVTTTFNKEKVPICSLHNKDSCSCLDIRQAESNSDLKNACHQQANKAISNPLANDLNRQPNNKATNLIDSKYCAEVQKSVYIQENNTNNPTTTLGDRQKEKKKGFFYTVNVLKDPAFLTLSVIQGLFAYTFNIWLTTMIDYSRDKGIDQSYEMYILSLNPITSIVGRVGLAWITDKGFLSVSSFCALLYILLAISSICIALATDFAIMFLGILLMTLAIGAYLSICAGLSYAFIEKDKQAVSIASNGLFYAPLSFTVSPLIGYFRGQHGSYDGLYYLLAAMNFACSLIVLFLPKLASRRERRKLKKYQNVAAIETSI